MLAFCNRLVRERFFKHGFTRILFISESNYGGSARAIEVLKAMFAWGLKKNIKVIGISADIKREDKPGFWNTGDRKEQMAIFMQQCLKLGTISLYTDVVSVVHQTITDELFNQMKGYEKRFKLKPDQGSDRDQLRREYHFGGKGGGSQDDLCVIVQITALVYSYHMTTQSPGGHRMLHYLTPKDLPAERKFGDDDDDITLAGFQKGLNGALKGPTRHMSENTRRMTELYPTVMRTGWKEDCQREMEDDEDFDEEERDAYFDRQAGMRVF